MKIYEKPMIVLEKIDVEDVITVSPETANLSDPDSAATAQLLQSAGTTGAIVFEW